MAKKKNIIAFLDHEPPRNPKKLKDAFVDRERELKQVVNHVKAVLQEDPRRILAITGLARVGKSHLLRRSMAELTRSFGAIIDVTITTGHADGRAVLREILHQISAQLGTAAGKKGVVGDGGRPVLEPLDEIGRVFSPAIAGHGTVKVSEEERKGLKQHLGASLKSPGLPSIFGALGASLDSTREQSETESRTLEMQPLDEQALCDLVSWGHELVRVRKPSWNTLLIIDDFDILRRSADGSFDPVPLMQQLSSLAQVEGLHVLTTVREDTYHIYPKSFYLLTSVAPFGSVDLLIEAYRRRVKLYHGGEDPLPSEVVKEMAERTEGRIGIFFRWLRDFYNAPESDFSGWFWSKWNSYQKYELEAAQCIQEAAKRGGEGRLSEEEAEKVQGTSLMGFVVEDYSSLDKIRVDPMVQSLIREQP